MARKATISDSEEVLVAVGSGPAARARTEKNDALASRRLSKRSSHLLDGVWSDLHSDSFAVTATPELDCLRLDRRLEALIPEGFLLEA